MIRKTFGCLLLLFVTSWAMAQPETRYEVQPTDAKMTKIVVVAGAVSGNQKPGEHEFPAGCIVLADLLKQTPGVFPVLVREGWPKNPETFTNAKAVVFFLDGGDAHPFLQGDRMVQLQKMADAGVGLVHLHTVIDYPKDLGKRSMPWLGGVFEKGHSLRAHWIADYQTFPDHPVCRGVTPFQIDDGWLWKLRFMPGMKGVTPICRTVSPKAAAAGAKLDDDAIVSWTYDRPGGGRSFVFTGAHLHSSYGIEAYRKLIVNGVVWSAGLEVPAKGSPVALDPAELKKNFEPRPAKKK